MMVTIGVGSFYWECGKEESEKEIEAKEKRNDLSLSAGFSLLTWRVVFGVYPNPASWSLKVVIGATRLTQALSIMTGPIVFCCWRVHGENKAVFRQRVLGDWGC